MEIPLDKIKPNDWNPRASYDDQAMHKLIESIKRFGVLQPILVRPHPSEDGYYQLVYGQRRWTACKRLGLDTILVLEPIKTISDAEAVDMMGDENINRQSYSPVELSKYIEIRRKILGETSKNIAERFGVDESHVRHIAQLERLPDEIKPKVTWGAPAFSREAGVKPTLTVEHARQILRVPDKERQLEIAKVIEQKDLTVIQTKKMIDETVGKAPKIIEEIDTGISWTCPICQKEHHLIHVSPNNSHRLEEIPIDRDT